MPFGATLMWFMPDNDGGVANPFNAPLLWYCMGHKGQRLLAAKKFAIETIELLSSSAINRKYLHRMWYIYNGLWDLEAGIRFLDGKMWILWNDDTLTGIKEPLLTH